MEKRMLIILLVVAMLLTAGINAVSTKVLFMQHSTGKDGERAQFKKPWFGAFQMLVAMFLVGLVDTILRRMCKPARTVDYNQQGVSLADLSGSGGSAEPALVSGSSTGRPYWVKALLVAVPGFFDLFATGLLCYGYLWTPTSVVSMLRGSCIVFSAVFSVLILGRKLAGFNWFGVFLCMLGICVVGVSEALACTADSGDSAATDGPPDADKVPGGLVVLGMCLVTGSQVVQALQLVIEEFIMKDKDSILPPMQIVGWEGLWGTLIMIFVLYPLLWAIPGADHGHLEDAIDTIYQIKNSGSVVACTTTYIVSCATFNAVGIAITQQLTSVHRILIQAVSTALVWVFGLIVHYYIDKTAAYGESWTTYSPLKAVGFLILVCGQLVYGEVVRLPCFNYAQSTSNRIEDNMKSPSALKCHVTPSRRSP